MDALVARKDPEREAQDVVSDMCVGTGAGTGDLDHRMASTIESEVGEAKYRKYFTGVARFGMTPDGVCVRVPTSFQRDWMERWFGASVEAAARGVLGSASARVTWRVDGSTQAPPSARVSEAESRGAPAAPCVWATPPARDTARREPAGDARTARAQWVSLDDFVVGDSNRSAWHAARVIAEERSPVASVLFLHGACGVGKTHLLQGAAKRYLEVHPGARVRCTTAEAFANEYIAAVRDARVKPFRARFREIDLLCLDDVHFIGGKKGTQSEFLHTFNALGEVRARVILASDAHPKVLREVQSAIVSRFVSGMVEKLDGPDRALRARIVSHLAGRRGLSLSAGAIDVIAESAPGSVRELFGAVARIEAMIRLGGEGGPTEVSAAAARRALGIGAGMGPVRPVRMDEIARAAGEVLGIEVSEVYGPSRHRRAVLARSVAVCLAKEITTHSFPEIARMLHRRNHSTVVTQRKRFRAEMDRGGACRCGGDLDGLRVADLYDRVRTRVLAGAR